MVWLWLGSIVCLRGGGRGQLCDGRRLGCGLRRLGRGRWGGTGSSPSSLGGKFLARRVLYACLSRAWGSRTGDGDALLMKELNVAALLGGSALSGPAAGGSSADMVACSSGVGG